jgi:hypothetical protein
MHLLHIFMKFINMVQLKVVNQTFSNYTIIHFKTTYLLNLGLTNVENPSNLSKYFSYFL